MNLTDAVIVVEELRDDLGTTEGSAQQVDALDVVLRAIAASPIVVVTEHLPPVAPALPDAPPTSGGGDA